MTTYIIRQFFYSLLIIFGVMTVTFCIIRVLPGKPERLMAGQRADQQTVASIRKQLKLDEPIYVQYIDFMGKAVTGDFGRSYAMNLPVLETILDHFPATLYLSVSALLISSLLGVAIGIVSAVKPESVFDNAANLFAMLGISVPVFVLGLLMALIFSTTLHLLPGSGYFIQNGHLQLQYLLLPMLTLAARPLSIIARITRSSMLEVMSQDYIRTARAKGLQLRTTILRHALRNALNPVVTTISAWLAGTIAGTFFIEFIFYWPGLGGLAYDAVMQLDYPIIQGTVMFSAVVFALVNFMVDIIYALLDPKVRLS